MVGTLTSISLDARLAAEAARVLGVKSRTEAVHIALRQIVGLKRSKDLTKRSAGKFKSAGHTGKSEIRRQRHGIK